VGLKAQPPTLVWIRTLEPNTYPYYSYGTGIRANASGEIFVTGATGTGAAAFIAKYNRDGSVLWTDHLGGPGGYNDGESIAIDQAGNSYISGRVGSSVFVAKYDNAGNRQWMRQAGSSDINVGATAIALDSAMNLCVPGLFHRYLNFGTTNLVNNGTGDLSDLEAFVAKFE